MTWRRPVEFDEFDVPHNSPRRATRNIDRDFVLSEVRIVVGLLARVTLYLRQTSSAGRLQTSSARLCMSSTCLADQVLYG